MTFDFSITYFDIQIENTIQQQSPDFILTYCFEDAPVLASPVFNNVGSRNPTLAVVTRSILFGHLGDLHA